MPEIFSDGAKFVTRIAIDMRDAIIELAGDRAIFDSRANWLARAARRAGISCRMAKAIFYLEVSDPKSSVVEQIRAAQTKKRKDDALRNEGSQALAILQERVQRLENALRMAGADFHSNTIDALRREAGRNHSSLD